MPANQQQRFRKRNSQANQRPRPVARLPLLIGTYVCESSLSLSSRLKKSSDNMQNLSN